MLAFNPDNSDRDTLSNVLNIVVACVLQAPLPSIFDRVDPEYLDRMSSKEVKDVLTPTPEGVLVAFMQLNSAVCDVVYAVDDATADDSAVRRSDTIAHSSHVTYTGADCPRDTPPKATDTRNFLVPRLPYDTLLTVDVLTVPRFVQPPLDHCCHW